MSSSGFPLAPGVVIGILGGGQLGRMLAMAAARLGFDVAILTPEKDSPAARVAAHAIVGAYDDEAALAELARLSDAVTFEFENVPAAVVARLQALGVEVAPGPKALAVAQDRVAEKSFFVEVGVPTVAFAAIDTAADIAPALRRLGAPALLKTRREGYDGKGQAWVNSAAEADAAFAAIGAVPAVLEQKAPFVREVSVIAARGRDGAVADYPLTQNTHEDGILRRSVAPAPAAEAVRAQATAIVTTLLDRLDYVGVIGVEMFELEDGRLLVNEFAPRVHNSGHWTLDACQVDQFEQHIRAVAGWPLGPTEPMMAAEMTNLLGAEAADWATLSDPDARVWLYGKRGSRAYDARRKMGHVNRLKPL